MRLNKLPVASLSSRTIRGVNGVLMTSAILNRCNNARPPFRRQPRGEVMHCSHWSSPISTSFDQSNRRIAIRCGISDLAAPDRVCLAAQPACNCVRTLAYLALALATEPQVRELPRPPSTNYPLLHHDFDDHTIAYHNKRRYIRESSLTIRLSIDVSYRTPL